MMLRLYDTRTRQISPVEPLEPGLVRMYTCGPTVYRDVHLGNLRSYLIADWLRRALEVQGVSVTQVKNITDVGHMRQERLEQGEDKVIAAAMAEGKTSQEIAQFYTDRFQADERKLNITPAEHYPKATDHIDDMIAIVKRLVEKGYAYEVQGNVYFDVSAFPGYGALSGNTEQQGLMEAVRVEADPLKQRPQDFTLWKLAEPNRELKWSSPWGEGFPGWHIECSAMSIKYLGDHFDVHTGGVDNIFPHHEGEIAQSESFVGGRVVSQWVHGQHLLADGVKMAKSAGNSFTLADIEAQAIEPLAFRYLCLTTRFQSRLNFTFTALKAAQRALLRLKDRVWEWEALSDPEDVRPEVQADWERRFLDRINDNLDLPGALALSWQLARSDLPMRLKLDTMMTYERVLGLGLDQISERYRVPGDVMQVVERRARAREEADYERADGFREKLDEDGHVLRDTPGGTRVRQKSPWEMRQDSRDTVSSSAEVSSLVDEPDKADFTVGLVAGGHWDDVSRCVTSALRWAGDRSVEVVVLDNGSPDGTAERLTETAAADPRIRVVYADYPLGEGAARNIVLKQSRGQTVLLLDSSVELTGDIYGPILRLLDGRSVGVVGPFGLRTDDLRHFHEEVAGPTDVDAMQAYCFAFRRRRLRDVGLMRESFRFYRNLDLDYSFHFRNKGYRIVTDPALPVRLHEHRVWSELDKAELEELSRRNFRRFLHKWGQRSDLLVGQRLP